MSSDLITQAEAGRLRGVSREAIGDLVRRGKLKVRVIGGVPFVSRKQVLEFQPARGGRPPATRKSRGAEG